jgi:CelD/BcsL family acetyltransferase involved in cellulose biosynthesis
VGDNRPPGVRDLEEVRGADWSRATWAVPSEDASLVLARQTLTALGGREVVWRVPAPRLPELCELVAAPESDADGLLAWAEEEPDRLDALVDGLGRMDPSVVDDIALS